MAIDITYTTIRGDVRAITVDPDDAYSGFQIAIDACSVEGGGVLTVPEDVYVLHEGLTLPDGVKTEGDD